MAAKRYDLRGEPDARMAEQIDDMLRDLYEAAAGSTHTMLSSTHSDTTEASVVRGDLIIGGSTSWQRLALATTSTHFVGTDGFDVTWRAIQETDITDGTIFPRLASTETIAALWRFNAGILLGASQKLLLRNAGDTANLQLLTGASGSGWTLGDPATTMGNLGTIAIAGGSRLSIFHNATDGYLTPVANNMGLGDGSVAWTYIQVNKVYATQSVHFAGAISPAALAAGNTNNYNPTDLANTFALRLSGNVVTSVLTGLTAPSAGALNGDGRTHLLVNIGANPIDITNEDAASTAANRFLTVTGATVTLAQNATMLLWYDTTSDRWRQGS